MSELARDFYASNPAMFGPLISIVLFTLVFIVASVRAATVSRAHVEKMSNLVLEGEQDHG